MKKLNGRLAELQAAYDKMKAEWDLAADQLERHKEVVKEMEDGRKENAKLQVKISRCGMLWMGLSPGCPATVGT